MKQTNEYYMQKAIQLAKWCRKMDEVPVGCVIEKDGAIIGWGYNTRQKKQNAMGHAELMAISQASKAIGSWRLEGCTLYVTLEPCPMCAGAIIQSRIPKVIYGASDPKGGCAGSCIDLFSVPGFNHYPEVEKGVCKEECAQMLKDFFRAKRKAKKSEG